MKKRIALILALALACCLLVGVLPASAATTVTNYYALTVNGTAQLDLSAKVTAGKTVVVDQSYNHSVVQVLDNGKGGITLVGVAYGTTNVAVNVLSGSTVEEVYNCSVNVSYSSAGNLVDVSGAIVALQIRKSYTSYSDLYVGETFTVNATVKDASGNNISSRVRYAWNITSGNAEVSSNYNGQSATIKITSGSTAGAAVTGSVTVYGDNGTSKTASFNTANDSIYNSYGTAVAQTGGYYAYGGKATFTYLDRDNGNAVLKAESLGTLGTLTNLPRTYRVSIGSQVGIGNRRVVDASPASMTFNSTLREYSVVVGVRTSTSSGGWTTPGAGSGTSYDYYPLGNGYTIIASIEAASNIPIMKIGGTEQLTAAMLGGVPVTAAGMTYATGDSRIAVVSSSGKITALASGITSLKVYYNGTQVIEKTIFVVADSVAVEDPEEETGLEFNITKVTRTLNTKVRFRIKTITLNGKKIAHKDLDWVSTKKTVCTVDSNGYIRTRGKGTCYIVGTTEDGEYTAKLKVTVK